MWVHTFKFAKVEAEVVVCVNRIIIEKLTAKIVFTK